MEFTRWAELHLGDGRLQLLREKAHGVCKLTKSDLEDIHKHLKSELARMRELRAQGVTGRIEFEDPM